MARRKSTRYRMKRRRLYRSKRKYRMKFSRDNNTKKISLGIPGEFKTQFTVLQNKSWSNIVDLDVLTLFRTPLMQQHIKLWDSFKINSMSANCMIVGLTGNRINERFKLWSLADTDGCYKDKLMEASNISANGVCPGAYFKNNPAAKWSIFTSGMRNSHRHYTKASTLNHKGTYLDFGFLWNQPVGYDEKEEKFTPSTTTNGLEDIPTSANAAGNIITATTGLYTLPNAGNAFLPRIKFAIQAIEGTWQEAAPLAMTMNVHVKFNVTFKGIRYSPTGDVQDDIKELNQEEN